MIEAQNNPTFFLFPTKYEKSWISRVGGGGGVGGVLSPHIKKDGNLREMISLVLNWFGH